MQLSWRRFGSPSAFRRLSSSCTSQPGADAEPPPCFSDENERTRGVQPSFSRCVGCAADALTWPPFSLRYGCNSLSPEFVAKRAAARGVPCAKPDALVPFLYVMDGLAREGSPSVRAARLSALRGSFGHLGGGPIDPFRRTPEPFRHRAGRLSSSPCIPITAAGTDPPPHARLPAPLTPSADGIRSPLPRCRRLRTPAPCTTT